MSQCKTQNRLAYQAACLLDFWAVLGLFTTSHGSMWIINWACGCPSCPAQALAKARAWVDPPCFARDSDLCTKGRYEGGLLGGASPRLAILSDEMTRRRLCRHRSATVARGMLTARARTARHIGRRWERERGSARENDLNRNRLTRWTRVKIVFNFQILLIPILVNEKYFWSSEFFLQIVLSGD
jgi:hypothetical protein